MKLFFYGSPGTATNPDFNISSYSFKARINESCGVSVVTLSKTKPSQDEDKSSDYFTVLGLSKLIFIGNLN